jgi:hypothetical protein
MSKKPIRPLRRRMLEDMAVHRLGEKTKSNYIHHMPLTRHGNCRGRPPLPGSFRRPVARAWSQPKLCQSWLASRLTEQMEGKTPGVEKGPCLPNFLPDTRAAPCGVARS